MYLVTTKAAAAKQELLFNKLTSVLCPLACPDGRKATEFYNAHVKAHLYL
jgi:hypothetical protein